MLLLKDRHQERRYLMPEDVRVRGRIAVLEDPENFQPILTIAGPGGRRPLVELTARDGGARAVAWIGKCPVNRTTAAITGTTRSPSTNPIRLLAMSRSHSSVFG